MYKAAIIGCGMIAGLYEDFSVPRTYSHAKAYRKNGAVGSIAFVDADAGRARELAEKAGGEVFPDIRSMMSSFRPDIVSICTPDNLHFEMVEMLLQEGSVPRVIFVEKPVCGSREELAKLMRLQRASKAMVIVNHSRRFDDAHQRLKVLFESGELGPLVRIHVDYYGGWRHLGVHIIDILQYMLGDVVEINRVEYHCESKYNDDPTLNVTGCIAGAMLNLEGFKEEYYQVIDINIMCQRGQVKLTDFGKRVEIFRKIMNAEHENVLILDRCEKGMLNCISTAVEQICRFLDSEESAILEPYGLDEASNTMNTIWNGMEIYAAQS